MLANNILPSAEHTTPARILIARAKGKAEANKQFDRNLQALRDNGLTIENLSILLDTTREDSYEQWDLSNKCFPTFPEHVGDAEERQARLVAYADQLDVRAKDVEALISELQDNEDKEDLSEQTVRPFVTRIKEEPASANAIIRFLNRQFAGVYTDSSFSLYEGDLSFWFFNCDQLCLEFGGWGQRFMIFDLFNSGVYAICIATGDAEGEYLVHFGHWSAAMSCMYQHIVDEGSLQYVRKHGTTFSKVWLPHFDTNPSWDHTEGVHPGSRCPVRSEELARRLSNHLHRPRPSDFDQPLNLEIELPA